jgi:hypothetical protein
MIITSLLIFSSSFFFYTTNNFPAKIMASTLRRYVLHKMEGDMLKKTILSVNNHNVITIRATTNPMQVARKPGRYKLSWLEIIDP